MILKEFTVSTVMFVYYVLILSIFTWIQVLLNYLMSRIDYMEQPCPLICLLLKN